MPVYQGRTVFAQVMDFLPMFKFRQCVDRYKGNKGVRTFSCLDQYRCMAFAQLTYRESLRDIECCLRSMHRKLYLTDLIQGDIDADGTIPGWYVELKPFFDRKFGANWQNTQKEFWKDFG